MSSHSGDDQCAAGALPWRRHKGKLLVALVHRPRYDDWTWAKGKLDAGEDWPVAAVREVFEETGLRVRLGVPLPTMEYPIHGPTGAEITKTVRYWAASVTGGGGTLRHEVDRVRWVPPKKARDLLTYPRDRDQLNALVAADQSRRLRTWPLVVVRHAHAVPRSAWNKNDWRRPLDDRGTHQSDALVGVLAAYGVSSLVTSSATRCVHTLKPYARSRKLKVKSTAVLSEEGFEHQPHLVDKQLKSMLGRGEPVAVCSHGPVLPDLLAGLARWVRTPDAVTRKTLDAARSENLGKGEALICHLSGTGKKAQLVAVERHLPLL